MDAEFERVEVERVTLPSGAVLTVPTMDETLRVKAFLAVQRNQVRDYLDIAALADRLGAEAAASVLTGIDAYYADLRAGDEAISTQVARQLADPRPADAKTRTQLRQYKRLAARWTWDEVTRVLREVAGKMMDT